MSRLPIAFLIAVASPALLFPQAGSIYPRGGLLNAASFAAPGLPHGSIARGSEFSIFGLGLGPASSPTLAFPLSTSLGGVTISVFQGATSVNAIPVFVSPTQINAIMPSNAPLGLASVQVTFNTFTTNPAPVRIVNSSFGIYTATGLGLGPGILQNFNSATDQPINAPSLAAKPGQTVTLWGTGLGPVSYADNIPPTGANLPTQTEVFVGGKLARPLYNGRSPCCSGNDQIVFAVPADAPLGCYVPVFVRTEGKIVSNSVTMAITADGSPCSEPANPFTAPLLKGGNIGYVELRRSVGHDLLTLSTPIDYTTDHSLLNFRREKGGTFAFNPKLSLPPAGSCTVYTTIGDIRVSGNLLGTSPTGRFLDPGPSFTVNGPNGGSRKIVPPQPPRVQAAQLGRSFPAAGLFSNAILEPGPIAVSSAGGPDVGPISVTLNNPGILTWSNRDQISAIDRTQPLTITWTGAPAGTPVEITGGAFDRSKNASAMFLCIAPADTTSFTVPGYILSSLPPGPNSVSPAGGYLTVGALNAPATFSATGLDVGVASIQSFTGTTVTYK